MSREKQAGHFDSLRVALLQMRCCGTRDENLTRAKELIRSAAESGAQIVCLPELFLSPYFCQSEDHANFALAETIPGPTTQVLSALAGEMGCVIVASLFERRAAGLFHNTAVVFDADGELVGRYRKMHIPDDPLYYEKFYFTPGDLGFRVFSTRFGNIGVLICWDQWFPEAARITALKGADLLFYPTAIGWHPAEKDEFGSAQHAAWELTQRAHAVANGCYVFAVNRFGHEHLAQTSAAVAAINRSELAAAVDEDDPGLEFWGQSFAVAPSGEILVRGTANDTAVLIVDAELSAVETARTHWPFLRDRRIDAYQPLTQRFLDN